MKPADLARIKLRMPPGESWQFVGTALGANPSALAFTEVYTALQTGAIDAQGNALPAKKNMKFYEVTNQIISTSHFIAANHFVIGLQKWNSLTPDQQRRVQAAALKSEEAITNMARKEDSELIAFFKKEGLDVYCLHSASCVSLRFKFAARLDRRRLATSAGCGASCGAQPS